MSSIRSVSSQEFAYQHLVLSQFVATPDVKPYGRWRHICQLIEALVDRLLNPRLVLPGLHTAETVVRENNFLGHGEHHRGEG